MEDSVKVSEEEIQEEQRLLRWYRKLAYATGNFITVLSISIWFPYNLVFFQNVLGLSASAAGNIVLISQIGGAISTPFIGTWSDQCYCPIPGRRKVFHLMGIICISCVLFFLWYDCLGCYDVAEPYKILYYSSFAIVFQFSWASIQIGQLALLPELCSQKKTQVQLNSMRYSFTIIANLIIFGCFWGLLELFNHDGSSDLSKNDLNIFPIMVAIVIGLGFPSSVLFQFLIPEKKNVILKKLKWYKWLMNPKFYLTAACLVASRFIVLLPQGYIPFYFQKTLNMDKSSIAKGPLVLFIVSFVSTLVVKRFRNFIGDKVCTTVVINTNTIKRSIA
jgi:Na+/melibiose symporter-like transporter